MEVDSPRMSRMVRNCSCSGARSMASITYPLNRRPAESTDLELRAETNPERGARGRDVDLLKTQKQTQR